MHRIRVTQAFIDGCDDRIPQNLTILLNAAEKLRSSEGDAADESLRCVANALLLVDEARTTWVEIHGADHCVTILEVRYHSSSRYCSVISTINHRNRRLPILSS